MTRDHPSDRSSPRPERMVEAVVVLSLLVCLAVPWLACWLWNWWAGLLGVLASHVLYGIILKPPGICMGIAWIYVVLNGLLVVIAESAAWLLSLF